jgi:hypothetical protein
LIVTIRNRTETSSVHGCQILLSIGFFERRRELWGRRVDWPPRGTRGLALTPLPITPEWFSLESFRMGKMLDYVQEWKLLDPQPLWNEQPAVLKLLTPAGIHDEKITRLP